MPCSVCKPRVEQPSTMERAWPSFGFCWIVALNKSGFAPLYEVMCTSTMQELYFLGRVQRTVLFSNHVFFCFFPSPLFSWQLQVLHEPLIDEDPVFIATCTERELRKRKKRKFSLWVRQCSSTGFICQVGFNSSDVLLQFHQALKCVAGPKVTVTSLHCLVGGCNLNADSDSHRY